MTTKPNYRLFFVEPGRELPGIWCYLGFDQYYQKAVVAKQLHQSRRCQRLSVNAVESWEYLGIVSVWTSIPKKIL